VLDACPGAKVLPALRRGNVVGATQLGLAPRDGGLDATGILGAAADGRIDLLVLLGADPLADFPDAELARRALAGARRVISVDTFLTDSSAGSDVVLAAAAYGEKSGTTTNLEGRVTTVGQKVSVAGTSRPDWMIAVELAELLDHVDLADALTSVEAVTDTIAATVPGYAGVTRAALAGAADGLLAVPPATTAFDPEIVRATDRVRYDYRLVLSRKLYDRAVTTAHAPSLAPLASRGGAHVHPLDLDGIGVTDGTEVRIVGSKGTVVLPIEGDARVPRGSLLVPFNVDGASVADILDVAAPAIDVRVERLS
jgi:NADH-quinone oxidoreductase subunit G